jgi:multidrug efflux pump
MARFFIDRPVFAWVLALLISLGGLLCIRVLPIAQYPSIAPPAVSVTATYPGASAKTLQDAVTSVIEQQMNGIDGLLYMSSTSDSSGQSTITLSFQPGTNPDIAQVQVQNKLSLATPSLPSVVQQQGIAVQKATNNYLMFFTLSSTDGSMDEIALGNYVNTNLLDPIRRVPGVGEADLFGSQYAMRVWMDPAKLVSYSLAPSDIIAAITAQNAQVAVGQIGARPAIQGQQLNVTLQGQTTLSTPEEFGNILLRVNQDGSRVRLRDVARVAFGAQDYTLQARVRGKAAAAVGVKLTPSANALETTKLIQQKIDSLKRFFPKGVEVDYPYNTALFIRISIEDVLKTLIEAMILVFLVMYLFLQNLRATFIPTIVVPVALLGTCVTMSAFGYSINVLTMFGMVLAIGLLVDDAIVVIENVERIMTEEGLSPRDATRKAMEQITSALIGITLVLTAVFVPMAFFGGSVGAIYRQFSLALVASMIFSVTLALTLTPALCASLLKPVVKGAKHERGGFFGWFNRTFNASSLRYQSGVGRLLKGLGWVMAVFAAFSALMVVLFIKLPSSFLPDEDQGYFVTAVQLPVGATQERTIEVLKKVEAYYLAQPEINDIITLAGFSFNGKGQNTALAFAQLKDWKLRKKTAQHVEGVVGRAFVALASIRDAIIFPINPPPIAELGNASGIEFELEDQGGLGHDKLMAARNQLMGLAAKSPLLAGMRPQGMEDTPQLKINIDQDKVTALGVALGDVNTTLQAAFGSYYVNNFIDVTRVQQVTIQLDAPFRMAPDDLGKLFVRNASGTMVPFSAFASLSWIYASPRLETYNGLPSLDMVSSVAPGRSSGDAMTAVEGLVAKLPKGIGIEWTGQSYQERLSGSQAPALYAISLVVVFLCLAALYESWVIPLSVIMVVPLGILGAVLAVTFRGLPNDVYFKVGLLTTVGLATKNAILIIEYAKDLQEKGMDLVAATLEAVHLRLRPILMTSFAFILGVMPLALSDGAGSASQHAIGTGVIGGMLASTFLGIFFIPVFFVFVRKLFPYRPPAHAAPPPEPAPAPAPATAPVPVAADPS